MPTRVSRLDQPPHRCSFTMRGEDPEGFFMGETLAGWDPRAAISVSYARSLARELGYVHPDDYALMLDDRNTAWAEIERLKAENEALNAQFDAIDLLESEGFRARKKPGRKPTERQEAAA